MNIAQVLGNPGSVSINCTASTLRAILCYIDSGVTRRIAFDRDDLADALVDHVKAAVGDRGGSQSVSILFTDDQAELRRQFRGVCENIKGVFAQLDHEYR